MLLGRRPDIADLELTCVNSNTEVPYVDLVLEILENAIAMPIEIATPYGFDPNTDLAQTPLADAVATALRNVLERSAVSVGDTLSVALSPKTLLVGTYDDWLITDGFRHWVLRYYPQTLVVQRSRFLAARQLNVTDYTAAVTALDSGSLVTNDWVLPATRDPREKNLPVKGNPTVTALQAGISWTVNFTRAVRVSTTQHGNSGALILTSPDGVQQLLSVPCTVVALQHLVLALNARRLAEPLVSLLPPSLTYSVAAVGTQWEVSTVGTVTITFTAQRLQLASLTYQSTDARSDLLASPENRNPEAYVKLNAAVYPWALPFNLWLEEVRAFLSRRGISRRSLMEQCVPATRFTDQGIARELLGLSLSQATIIVGADAHQPWEFWGLQQGGNRVVDRNDPGTVASGTWLDVLGTNVSLLIQQAALSYRELLNVLQCQFVRATMPVLTPSGDDCNPSEMKLAGLVPGHLDRIHRLVRLWRIVGWSLFDLDLAIAAIPGGATTLDSAALLRLAGILRLQQCLGLAIGEIAAWWGQMTVGYYDYTVTEGATLTSLYERLFLNRNVVNPPDVAFALNAKRTELQYENPAVPPGIDEQVRHDPRCAEHHAGRVRPARRRSGGSERACGSGSAQPPQSCAPVSQCFACQGLAAAGSELFELQDADCHGRICEPRPIGRLRGYSAVRATHEFFAGYPELPLYLHPGRGSKSSAAA